MKIPGVYVEISGDSTQLAKDMRAAKQIVTDSAKGMSNALNNALSAGQVSGGTKKLIENLGTLSRASKVTGDTFDKLGVDLKDLQRLTGLTESQFGKLQSKLLQTQAAKAQENALKGLAKAAGLSNAEINQMGQQFGLSAAQISKVSTEVNKTGQSFSVMGGMVRAALAYFSVSTILEFGKSVFDTGVRVDSLQRSFVAITGSTESMISEFEFLDETAGRTGQNMFALADSYRQLTASTQGTVLEGKKTRDLFASMSEAAAVLGLSTEKVELSLKAFGQMAAKGTVQMEELKGQLGDSLPGALKVAASAMGVTQKALIKMIEQGELLASDLLPKMSAELHKMYGEAAQTAALESGIAAVNRLSQAWTEFKNNLYGNKAAVAAINAVTTAISYWADAIGNPKSVSGITEQLKEEERLLSHNKALLESYQNSFLSSPATIAQYTQKVKDGESAVESLKKSLEGVKQASDPVFLASIDNARKYTDTFVVLEDMAVGAAEAISKAEDERAKEYWANEDKILSKAQQSADDQKRISEGLQNDRKRLEEEVTDALAKEGMTRTQQEIFELKKRYAENLKIAGDDIKLAKLVTQQYQDELKKRAGADSDYNAGWKAHQNRQQQSFRDAWQVNAENAGKANDQIEEKTLGTTSVIVSEWSNAFASVQSSLATMIYEFDFSMDSIIDIFKRMLAEMLAAILMSGIKEAFFAMINGGDMYGAFINGMGRAAGFGGMGGMGGGISGVGASGWTNPDGSGWGGKALGGLAVAGGAYGMYSGAQNLKKGNVGTGALQLGLGGLSAYQGAVMLGIVEKGAFTAGMNALGAKIGLTVAPKVAATVAASVGGPSASLAAAESAYLAGSAPAAPALSAAPTAAATGTPALATAAAYAVPALAAGLAIKGIIDKGNRPSASAEIDQYGVTPDNIREFNDEWKSLDGSILQTVPTLQKYNQAMYDTETQVLTLSNGTKELQLQYDAADQAGHQWSSTITNGTSIMSSSAAQIIDSFAPLPLTVDQVYEATTLAGNAFNQLANGSDNATRTTNQLRAYLENLGMTEDQAAAATQQLIDNVAEMGNATVTAAGAIAGSAGQVRAAYRALESVSYENSSGSDFSSHLVGGNDGQDLQYHAAGGVFTRPTRIGNHVFGEAGAEALVPLPSGVRSLDDIIKKLDQRGSGGGPTTIIFQIGTHEVKRVVLPMFDEHVAAKSRRGQLGVRTAYAAG